MEKFELFLIETVLFKVKKEVNLKFKEIFIVLLSSVKNLVVFFKCNVLSFCRLFRVYDVPLNDHK